MSEQRPPALGPRTATAREDRLRRDIADVLEECIRPLLPPDRHYHLTLIARTSRPKSNVVVTDDEMARVKAVLDGEGLD